MGRNVLFLSFSRIPLFQFAEFEHGQFLYILVHIFSRYSLLFPTAFKFFFSKFRL